MANFELLSFASADELAHAAAGAWLDEIAAANRAGTPHCVALSGGRITQKFFTTTVEQAKIRAVSFERVQFFWADERCVPATDADSNFKLADELLFAPLNISASQIHRLRGEDPPAVAAKLADAEIRRLAQAGNEGLPILDLIFLGMGEDGHVASLFPNSPANSPGAAVSFLVIENSPKPPPTRISLSYNMIFAAKNVWILAAGAGKEDILRTSLAANGSTPLARVLQTRKFSKIFTDLNL